MQAREPIPAPASSKPKRARRRKADPPPRLELKQLLYSYAQAAELLCISPAAVQALVYAGDLESVNVGQMQPRVTAASMTAYVERLSGRRGK